MLCGLETAVSVLIAQVAFAFPVPATTDTAPQPEISDPSLLNSTVPSVGTPPVPLFVTVAVNVTELSTVEGFADDVTTTLVPARLTVWVKLLLVPSP